MNTDRWREKAATQARIHCAGTFGWKTNLKGSQSNVGIHFQTPVFTHGQFLIAMSRCTFANGVKFLFPEYSTSNVTKNIVFPKALLKDTL